jgi:hypothetical protein
MKLIFLDIDGVLNRHVPNINGYCGLCPKNVNAFNYLLGVIPESRIVISSAWRYMVTRGSMTLAGFEHMLMIHGVMCKGRLVGHTVEDKKHVSSHFDAKAWKRNGLKERPEQIKGYIRAARPVNYVVLDDLPLKGLRNFVQTNSNVGLTIAHAAKAADILGISQRERRAPVRAG